MSGSKLSTQDAIASIVRVLIRRPLLTVGLILGLTALSIRYTANNLDINTDTADMISPDLAWRQDFKAYRDGFPARDRNIVVVIESESADLSSSYARDLAALLADEPELFPSVFLIGSGAFFDRNALLYLSIEELESVADQLIRTQPLLGRLSQDVSGAGILSVVTGVLESDDEVNVAGDDLDIVLNELSQTIAAAAVGSNRSIAWGQLLGADSLTGQRQMILVQPVVDFNRVRAAREAIERIRERGAELQSSYGGGARLRLTGTVVMEDEELASVVRSASAAGFAALAMVVLVLLWTLRSVRLLLIAVVTLLAGLCLTAAFAALTVGELNLLSVAFAVLYVGLGVDFVLHLSLRLKELCAAGSGVAEGLAEAARGVGHSLVICALTTAVGFLAFVPTDFTGISQLGLISGGGMLISLCVSLSLLPALICLFWKRNATIRPRLVITALEGLRLPAMPQRAIVGIAMVLVVLALAVLPGLRFDGNPIHLRNPSAESIETLEDLANDNDAPIFSLALLTPDLASAEQAAAELSGLDTVDSVRTPGSLVPDDQEDKLLIIEDLDLYIGSTLAGFSSGEFNAARFEAETNRLIAVLEARRSNSDAEARLLAAVREWRESQSALDSADSAAQAFALDRGLRGNLVGQVQRLRSGLGATAFGFPDLPDELQSRMINTDGLALVEIVPKENLNDNAAAARFVAEVRSVAPSATGLPVVHHEAAATVTRAFSFALLYAFIAVSLMLLLFLRSLRDTVLVLVPIVFAAVLTAAAAVVLGLPLNFANIIALPLLIGVGVDSGIHMVHRMRTEPPADGNPLGTSTSRAVLASALTTIASFGNLAFSEHLGMASMGQLLTLGMLISLVSILVLLPSLMKFRRTA